MKQTEIKYLLALSLIKGIGFLTFKKLINKLGSAEEVFRASKKDILQVRNSSKIADLIINKNTIKEAERIIEANEKNNIKITIHGQSTYPQNLYNIYNPPIVLHYKGSLNYLQNRKTISIVGTRKPNQYAKEILEDIINDLKHYSVSIVSGLAYGIDIAAHDIAVKKNIPNYAILAGGIGKIYPPTHIHTVKEIIKHGGIITEYSINTQPETHHFPVRNRIIAGISDITIVVQAGKNSGALITANLANEYNREVFAIPGNINSQYANGCNSLIKKHKAHLMTSVEDIGYIMNWDKTKVVENDTKVKLGEIIPNLTNKEKSIIKTLREAKNALHIDQICNETQISSNTVQNLMIQLEINNLIKVISGNKFKLL